MPKNILLSASNIIKTASRPMAILFSFISLYGIVPAISSPTKINWHHLVRNESLVILAFFAYSILILLPLQNSSKKVFIAYVCLGFSLLIPTIISFYHLYWFVVTSLLQSHAKFHFMAWALLIPHLLYFPATLLIRSFAIKTA